MRLIDAANSRSTDGHLVGDFHPIDHRPVEVGLCKGVSKAQPQLFEHVAAREHRYRAFECLGHGAKLVDTVAMVAMGMRNDDGRQSVDVRREKLLAKVRTAIDQDVLAGAFDHDRRSQAPIARFLRVATAPFIADLRHAGGRTAAEDPKLHPLPWGKA